jgi:hypothetical protein
MITITRRQARCLRGIFRRSALGISHRGIIPPLVLRAEGTQLRAHYRYVPVITVEYVECGVFSADETIGLPLDALADFEGRDASEVVLEAAAPDRTVVRWDDRGIPQLREHHVPAQDSGDAMPQLPGSWVDFPIDLLDAVVEAGKTGADSGTRYALNCIQLKGTTQQIIATDGHQLLVLAGFTFPWTDDILIRISPVFGSRELPRDRPVKLGRTATHVVVRVGPWTLFFEIQTDVRFPRVQEAIPGAQATTTRLIVEKADAAFLADALERLPGADEQFSPATVDCNGRIAIRARAEDRTQPTELVLGRSRYTGAAIRINTDRRFLARALRLGFTEIEIVDVNSPVVCRDRNRTYCWQLLSGGSAIEPTDDVIRIESTSQPVPAAIPLDEPPSTRTTMRQRTRATSDQNATNGATNGHMESVASGPTNGTANGQTNERASGHGAPENAEPVNLAALIQEAEALHETISTMKAQAGRLIVRLRRYRRRERLVASTLASLRELKLTEVAE